MQLLDEIQVLQEELTDTNSQIESINGLEDQLVYFLLYG
jgi:hypothetical protein